MISTLLSNVNVTPRRFESQLPARTRGTNVHPNNGLLPSLCLWGTRQNRVLANPERDGGRRLVEPHGPHYLTLPSPLQHPVIEALAPRGARHTWARVPAARAAQVGVDLLLGVLACVQILGLLSVGRTREATFIMMSHGNQLNLLAASTMTVGMFFGIAYGMGLL